MSSTATGPGLPQFFADGGPGLVVTDVDSTLIEQEVIEELAAEAGAREAVARITARAMNGELDFAHSLRERVAALAGLPVSVCARVAERVTVTRGARELIGAVHRAGGRFGVVSGGIDFHAANRLEASDGVLTGRVVGRIVTAEVKTACLRRWAAQCSVPLSRTVAIGDGANDVPMMREAGVGIAFCAKPAVRRLVAHQLNEPRLDALIAPLGLS